MRRKQFRHCRKDGDKPFISPFEAYMDGKGNIKNMAKSILSNDKKCFLCGSSQNIEKHHIMGNATRDKSEKMGVWVYLCRSCHDRIHFSKDSRKMMDSLRAKAQSKFEETRTREEWMKDFHRNYL
jgi:hypothetical protein